MLGAQSVATGRDDVRMHTGGPTHGESPKTLEEFPVYVAIGLAGLAKSYVTTVHCVAYLGVACIARCISRIGTVRRRC